MSQYADSEARALMIFHNNRPVLEALDDARRGQLLLALLDYSEFGTVPVFTGELRMAFIVLRQDVDRSLRRWEAECRRRSDAGKKSAALRAAKKTRLEVSCEGDAGEAAVCSPRPDVAEDRSTVLNTVEDCSTNATNTNTNSNPNPNSNSNSNPTVPPSGPPEGRARDFEQFWQAYPRKVGKQAARRAFDRVSVPLDRLLEALQRQRGDPAWQRENGRYIPHPATWLRQGRWEDEPAVARCGYQRHDEPLDPVMLLAVRRSLETLED